MIYNAQKTSIKAMTAAIFAMIAGLFLSFNVMADTIIEPSPDLSPEQVVEIQLLGLKLSGGDPSHIEMEQVWRFAHPSNKAMTGPIQRFAMLFATPSYKPLLGHDDYAIELIAEDENNAQMLVRVTANDGQAYLYLWNVLRVTDGVDKGSFMTISVSMPRGGGTSS